MRRENTLEPKFEPGDKQNLVRFKPRNPDDQVNASPTWWAPAALLNALTGDAVSRLAVPAWRAQILRAAEGDTEAQERAMAEFEIDADATVTLDWRKHFDSWKAGEDDDWTPYRAAIGPEFEGPLPAYNGDAGPLGAFRLFSDSEEAPGYVPLEQFFWALAEITELKSDGDTLRERVRAELDEYRENPMRATFLNGVHRRTLAVLAYYDRFTSEEREREWRGRMPIRLVEEEAYDFILHPEGIDLFLPPPFKDLDELRASILQQYKHRASGPLPMGLPLRGPEGPTPIINVGPDGASQGSPRWMKARFATDPPKWWITGDVYRDILTAIPRVIAAIWHEAAVFDTANKVRDKAADLMDLEGADLRTYMAKINGDPRDGFKRLIEERIETQLPDKMDLRLVDVDDLPAHLRATWDIREPLITSEGIWIADPCAPPRLRVLLAAIEEGRAGNPVFTHTWPCA